VFKVLLPALAIFAIASGAFASTPEKSGQVQQHSTAHTPAKKSTKATATNTPSHKPTKATGTKVAAHRKGKSIRRPSRSYQQVPSPERYKEIQQALTSKGYLQGDPTGEWGPDSVDALKRFQTDQSLMPDGKINSLSLIAMGLGPKRLTAKSDTTPLQPGTPAPSTPAPPPPTPAQ
jgi:hypothetical protein